MTGAKLIKKKYLVVGWREWVGLPELGIARIKAKVDTGARTSALHAFSIQPFQENGQEKVNFCIHPFQHDVLTVVCCTAQVVDRRLVTDSGGHSEERYVIKTPLFLGAYQYPIEITLTEREDMLFRMLLGRSALRGHFMVNPIRSFIMKAR